VLDGKKPQLSRRGFFGALGQMGKERMERALEEEAPPMLRPAVAVDQRLPRRLPHSRKELLARLSALAAFPFASVLVDTDVCSACGLCARVCPTDVLYFDGPGVGFLRAGNNPAYALDFQTRLCIDCTIYQVACPEDAIAFDDNLLVEKLHSPQAEHLAAGQVTACITCGVAVADHWQPPTCHVCRLGAGAVSPLR